VCLQDLAVALDSLDWLQTSAAVCFHLLWYTALAIVDYNTRTAVIIEREELMLQGMLEASKLRGVCILYFTLFYFTCSI
jgi:hypothetical protein